MYNEPLDVVPLWAVFVLSCALSWLAIELGERIGRWRLSRSAQEKEGPVGAVVGAIMALLAFMLAFTFSLAATRFDERRQLVLQDANAIRTAYLRAQTLPEPERSEVPKLLRDYLNTRVKARLSNPDMSALE